MPTLKVYRHGLTAGIPPSSAPLERSKRSECLGWSKSSTRANTAFLRSVRESDLHGHGISATLTLGTCPPNHSTWVAMRRAFLMRCQRAGLLRCHWLTEWQRRRVPHLHSALWFEDRPPDLIAMWCQVASDYLAGSRGQHTASIHDSVGWFKYLSKHASRGLQHYQRSPELIPPGWVRTGRMWGYTGSWPLTQPMTLDLCNPGFYALRRIMKNRFIANAREKGHWASVAYGRRLYQLRSPTSSSVCGLSEWVDLKDFITPLADHLDARGFRFGVKDEKQLST